MKINIIFKSSLCAVLSIFVLWRCEPELHFKEAQPRTDRDERSFKHRYQGTYLNVSDSSILTISEKGMSREWNYEVRMTEEQVDTTPGIAIKDGRLISEINLDPVSVRYKGDTAIMTWTRQQALFFLSDENVLRYFKGHYFINRKQGEGNWTVQTMQLDRDGKLTLRELSASDDAIANMESYTEVEEETDEEGYVVETSIKPSKRELKEIMKAQLFEEVEVFQKIKIKK